MTTDTRDEGTEVGSDAGAAFAVRYPTAIAVGGGLAAAVGSSFIPMNAIEGFVSAYGIAELLPAAAPPLGNTARLALSTGIGTLTAGALLALLPRGETDVMGFETAVQKDVAEAGTGDDQVAAKGFGATKLAGWLRTLRFGKAEPTEGEVTDFSELGRLRMRTGDQHPDAPVRAPIMASSDLGAPLDALPAADAPIAEPLALDADMAVAPPEPSLPPPALRFAPPVEEPVHEEVWQEPVLATDVINDAWDAAPPVDTAGAPAAPDMPADSADLSQLGIAALLDRLENGLARRREQASTLTADGTADAAPVRRIVPLALAASPEASDEATDELSSPRFALRDPAMGLPLEASLSAEQAETGYAATDIGTSDPALAYPVAPISLSDDEDVGPAEQAPIGEAADAPAAAEADSPVADDDMDAALRDALATLRQLSDRQRNL